MARSTRHVCPLWPYIHPELRRHHLPPVTARSSFLRQHPVTTHIRFCRKESAAGGSRLMAPAVWCGRWDQIGSVAVGHEGLGVVGRPTLVRSVLSAGAP